MPLNNISTRAIAGLVIAALLSAAISDSRVADDASAWIDDQYADAKDRI